MKTHTHTHTHTHTQAYLGDTVPAPALHKNSHQIIKNTHTHRYTLQIMQLGFQTISMKAIIQIKLVRKFFLDCQQR